ncbi:MAG: cobalamin biosynthesis protein [Paracoccaceae bacterium]
MRVAGIGFRPAATLASLTDALIRAGGKADLLATAATKADATVARELASELGLPLVPIELAELAHQPTLTHSPFVANRFGTGSVAEAAALAAAGQGAQLIGPRVVSGDGLATAAIAERKEE